MRAKRWRRAGGCRTYPFYLFVYRRPAHASPLRHIVDLRWLEHGGPWGVEVLSRHGGPGLTPKGPPAWSGVGHHSSSDLPFWRPRRGSPEVACVAVARRCAEALSFDRPEMHSERR